VTSVETHCTTTLAVRKQHCSPQYSHSTEPLSRCETSAETHCTNSITDPVIEKQQTNYKTTRLQIDHTVLLHRTYYKEWRSGLEDLALVQNQSHKNLTQGCLKIHVLGGFLIWKALPKDDQTKGALYLN